MPGASLAAQRTALRAFGPDNKTVIIFDSLMDSRSLFLTANTESIYALGWLNLKDGPVVVESPANTLGLVDDFWFHYVADLGIAGPDHGQGGKFLFLPPDYKGDVPAGYHVFKSSTYNNLFGDARFRRGWRSKAGSREHQAAPAHLPVGAGRQSAAAKLHRRVGQGVQHDSCAGFQLFRGGQRGCPGRTQRGDGSRNARIAGFHRHREGQALRTG